MDMWHLGTWAGGSAWPTAGLNLRGLLQPKWFNDFVPAPAKWECAQSVRRPCFTKSWPHSGQLLQSSSWLGTNRPKWPWSASAGAFTHALPWVRSSFKLSLGFGFVWEGLFSCMAITASLASRGPCCSSLTSWLDLWAASLPQLCLKIRVLG